MSQLAGLFGKKPDHPLADPRGLRRIISELPRDNAFKALDEVVGWLESLRGLDGFSAERLCEVLSLLDEAAQPHLRRLSREYLQAVRLPRAEEQRLWTICHGYWQLCSEAWERCLAEGERGSELAKGTWPLVCVKGIAATGGVLRWLSYRYTPLPGQLWQRLGRFLLAAERLGVAGKAVAMPPNGTSTATLEYQKVMVVQSASLDSLHPFEIDLAERLIAYFLRGFAFADQAATDSVYWVDLAEPMPPQRLAKMPAFATATQRFSKPGAAHAEMRSLLERLERGGEVPAEIGLGHHPYPAKIVPVLRHLCSYLAPIPPQRRHDRHRVMHRMAVLNGLVNAYVAFSGEFGGRPPGLQMESWVVENVSRGGFGASLGATSGDWLKLGALLAMQPEGGDNWLLGVVRRFRRESDSEARVGLETISRRVAAVEVKPLAASSFGAGAIVPALHLMDVGPADELRLVLPFSTFDPRERLSLHAGKSNRVLLPVALVEQSADYDIARYRFAD